MENDSVLKFRMNDYSYCLFLPHSKDLKFYMHWGRLLEEVQFCYYVCPKTYIKASNK